MHELVRSAGGYFVFCPNCGTQNTEDAASCQKCGFKIKDVKAQRFKGTMLMMNAPPELQQLRDQVGQQTPAQIPSAAPVPAAPPPTAPQAAAQPPAGTGPTGTAALPKQSFKGTMIGVAPPSMEQIRAAASQADTTPAGSAAVGNVNVSHVPSTAARSPDAMAAKGPPPVSPVNPLGGTLIAEAGGFAAAPSPGTPAPGAGDGPLASTMPSVAAQPAAFASTTPSAGNAVADFSQLAEKPPMIQTRPMPQVTGAKTAGTGLLIFSIVLLCAALAALVWSLL
jgi:hypothetical protein